MWPSLLLTIAITTADAPGKVLEPVELRGVRREPVAAAFLSDDLAVIACAKSGTLIFWDVKSAKIKHEYQVGQQLRGVVPVNDEELLVIDDKLHQLIHLRYAVQGVLILDRHPLPDHPIAMNEYSAKGRQHVAIASLWSRRVTIWAREYYVPGSDFQRFDLTKTIDLPFEPRSVLPFSVQTPLLDRGPSTFFVISGAFGGGLAHTISSDQTWKLIDTDKYGIGALAWDAQSKLIYYTHQTVKPQPITAESLRDGQIVGNHYSMLNSGLQVNDRYGKSELWDGPHGTGEQRDLRGGSGDPSGIALVNRQLLIALAGMNQVLMTTPNGGEGKRLPAGKRPRTIVTRGDRALVLGELDESVTLIDLRNPIEPKVTTTLLDPTTANRQLTPAERGERLFFDARMSAGGMMSCHSCHTDGHTNGMLADTLGDNTYGTPKRVLTLRGTRMTDLWAWNGEMKTLHDNVHKSLLDTMHAPKIEPRDVDDLVSFLHTLPPVPPLKPKPKDDVDAAQVARGERIFAREGCTSCHVPPLTFTSPGAYDVGMPDEKGLAKFNPPSLRGVGRLRRLFHDNRATSLKDVFETYGHQLKEPLPTAELADLVRYLESL